MSERKYKVYLCGDVPCPTDDDYEHRFYFGCVPKTFSDRTGRAKGHKQSRCDVEGCHRYHWDGGCNSVAIEHRMAGR
jgi:hypothetical protein